MLLVIKIIGAENLSAVNLVVIVVSSLILNMLLTFGQASTFVAGRLFPLT